MGDLAKMSWIKKLWPWKREKIQEELLVDEQFKAQLQEAFLRQTDLQEAVTRMQQVRRHYRGSLQSTPST